MTTLHPNRSYSVHLGGLMRGVMCGALGAVVGLLAMLVFASMAQAATTTVGLEAETFAPTDATKASVVNDANAYGGRAHKLTSRGQLVTDVDSGPISRISMRARRGAGNCTPNVQLLTRHRNADGNWGPTVSHGRRSVDRTYVWREWTGLTIPAGTNRIIVRDSCTATTLYADYVDYTHEPPPSPATSKAIVGIYEGWHDASGVDAFYSWLGYTGPQYAHEFVDHRYGWSTIGSCVWPGWRDWVAADDVNRRLTVSLPLLPESHAGQFAAVARGDFDAYWRQCAQTVADTPAEDTIFRLGWEMNGNTFPWRVGPTTVEDYKAAYKHVVQVMEAEEPSLEFEWEPNVTLDAAGLPFERLYPGDDVVDYIGLAVYDYKICGTRNTVEERWRCLKDPVANRADDNGMIHHASFAQAHGKPMTYTEYGLWPVTRPPYGGGDNPAFINRMADWMESHPVAYHIYNDGHGDHSLEKYPKSKATYKQRFGL